MTSPTIPLVTFIGKSNSGKTTLLVRLIPELKKRGYKVATIKHTHYNVSIDKEGKDSWKHRQAGADMTVLLSGTQMSYVKNLPEEPSLELIRDEYVNDVDILLAEGFKTCDMPKIWVYRAGNSSSIINKKDNLIAIASDEKAELDVPWFHLDNIESLADFIEERFLK